ncbi:hypothetical protein N602_25865 [Mycobacterium avium subsp. hominissuis 10-5606]|nr:hypothetical protein N602_25865 [Mycobacterium avium subsp. hominissuis 10-5606]
MCVADHATATVTLGWLWLAAIVIAGVAATFDKF